MIGEALPKAVGCGGIWRRGRTCCWPPAWRGWRFPAPGWGYAMPWRISGAALHIPHGLANAMLLPTVMGFNRMVCGALQPDRRALTGRKTDDLEAIAAVRELIAEVGLTMRLSDAGATPAHYATGHRRRRTTSVCAPIHAPPPGSRLSSCTRRRNKCGFSRGVWLWLSLALRLAGYRITAVCYAVAGKAFTPRPKVPECG